ncbi:MAG TPA: hypothetical protein VJ751_06690 [Pyrinomonadaceae bacterium]|jgi:hypothetical protein|nr:hypothetical protein [Pyrinomonadaceae bacterium]
MEPKRETIKRAATSASKTGASKKPQGQEESPSPGGETTNQETGGQNQDLLQQAKNATGEIINQVQQRAGSQIDRQKETAANELSQVVNAVRQFGQNLSGEANGPIARYAAEYGDKAADSLERLTNYIREQDAKRLLNDVQNFGRRQPALLLGGAFLLGFAGARLIKSSMDAASQDSMNRGHQSRYNTEVPHMSTNPPALPPAPKTI